MADSSPIVVSILLVNYNGKDVILDCLRSLEKYLLSVPYETIVVDNASEDGSPELIEKNFPQVRLIRQRENQGFGAGNNAGAKIAQGKFLFLLNTDTQLTCDILPHLITLMQQYPEVGIIGPRLNNPDGSLQISVASEIGILGEYHTRQQLKKYETSRDRAEIAQQFTTLQTVDIVLGAAFLIRKTLFDTLGGFDETFFMYFEESDLCQRTRDQGWKILYTPEVELIHLKGHSVNQTSNRMAVEYRRSQLYYYQKHRPLGEQMVLRIYLLIKFLASAVVSFNPIYLSLIALCFDRKHYPPKKTSAAS